MSETTGDDTAVSESGGTMQRLSGTASPRRVELALLEPHRLVGTDPGWVDAGSRPFLAPRATVLWR